MKKLLFWLILGPLAVFGQNIKIDTVDFEGKIHSIIFDHRTPNNHFIVEIQQKNQSVIHYYTDTLHQRFEFGDVIYHAYAYDGIIYVTLLKSKRLLLYDYYNDEVIATIDGLYSVHYVGDNYYFTQYQYDIFATNKTYYDSTGTCLLDSSFNRIPNTFKSGYFVVDTSPSKILLKEKLNWGQSTETTSVLLFDTKFMTYGKFIYKSKDDNISSMSISNDGRFVSIHDGDILYSFDTLTQKNYKRIVSQLTTPISYVSNNGMVLIEKLENKNRISHLTINTGAYDHVIDIKDVLRLKFYRTQVAVNKADKGIFFSASSKIIYHIKF